MTYGPARGVSSIGSQIGKCLAIAEHHGAPFDSFTACPLRRRTARNTNAPQMSPIDVATIGVEEKCFLVGSERPLLDFAVPGREELGRAAISRKGIQVLPAVFFRSQHQLVVGGPIENAASGVVGHVRKRFVRQCHCPRIQKWTLKVVAGHHNICKDIKQIFKDMHWTSASPSGKRFVTFIPNTARVTKMIVPRTSTQSQKFAAHPVEANL